MARFLLLLCFIALSKGYDPDSLKLEQVLILSRHHIRTPLRSRLESYTPKIWPKFDEPVAYLTKKGALLESYMAEYISEWMANQDFIKGCPKRDEVLIYANTLERTRATAKTFTEAAFKSCDICVQHNKDINVFDPIFLPVFHNDSECFKRAVGKEMERKLKEMDLTESYEELNRILDLQNSEMCKQQSLCDFNNVNTTVDYQEGEPKVVGPLSVTTSIVDRFLMSYYEGFPIENVAWGEITTDNQWKLLTNIIRQTFNVNFNLKLGSADFAEPLLHYMFDIFRNGKPKLAVLVGHDTNIATVMTSLGFKEFELKDQFEPYPIGGKLMFQKWTDGKNKYLKIEYVYQTFSQVRNGTELSMENPPNRVVLELNECKIDENGFCPWGYFKKLNF